MRWNWLRLDENVIRNTLDRLNNMIIPHDQLKVVLPVLDTADLQKHPKAPEDLKAMPIRHITFVRDTIASPWRYYPD